MNQALHGRPSTSRFLFSILLLLFSQGMLSCTGNPETDTKPSAVTTGIMQESIDERMITPIPNPRAEEALRRNFGGFVRHLINERDLTIRQDDLLLLLKDRPSFLIDLRKPLEVKRTGHIPGAVLIPLRDLGRKTSALPSFSIPIVVYCQKTSECLIALTGLGVYGWDIRVLEGGFEAWAAAGRPISMDPIPVPVIDPFKPAFPCCGIYQQSAEVAANPNAPNASLVAATDRMFDRIPDGFGAITMEELQHEILVNPSLVLIDLRPTDASGAHQPFKSPNLVNIPFSKLVEARESWPEDKSSAIVMYCEDGSLSPLAMTVFWAWGYQNTRQLQGGVAETTD